MKQAATGASKLLGRRAVPGIAMLVLLSFALMAGLLVQIARRQDQHASEQADRFAHAALDRRREVMAKEIKDYAAWGEAYQHLHLRTDLDWAFEQKNVGPTLYNEFGYDDVLVVGPDGKVTYALVGGELAIGQPLDLPGPGLATLVANARADPSGEGKPAVGVLKGRDGPMLVAAATITTGGDPTIVPAPGPPSVIVFADTLTPVRLEEIGSQAFVHGLRMPRDGVDARAGPSLVVETADRAGSITLRWDPERPGLLLLEVILPWLCLAGAAFALLAVLIVRRIMRAAALLETNAQALADAHGQAEHAALHDSVTGLANRLMLNRYLDRMLGGGPASLPVAVVYIDLDRFKPINDALGHRAGDQVLRATGGRLRAMVSDHDLVARVGGDEFVLALAGLHATGQVESLCGRLLDAVRMPIDVEGTVIQVGLSIGIAFAPGDAQRADDLLRHADIAMYQAKIEGGNAYRFFSAGMNERIATRIALEHDLRRALDAGEFVMHFQPRFETSSMTFLGVEALLRWEHPVRGLLAPEAFIDLAEQTGLIVALGAWTLRRACETVAAYPGLSVSVNVSSAQFRGPDLVEHVRSALTASGLDPGRLELETTESVLLEDVDRGSTILNALKGLGVRLAMDHCGMGYARLGHLSRFPFDRLKIDQRLVADLGPTGQARGIIQAVLGLGRALDLTVTAEGVETPEQLMLLRMDRCDEVQGFHLSPPVSEARLDDMMRAMARSERPALRQAN